MLCCWVAFTGDTSSTFLTMNFRRQMFQLISRSFSSFFQSQGRYPKIKKRLKRHLTVTSPFTHFLFLADVSNLSDSEIRREPLLHGYCVLDLRLWGNVCQCISSIVLYSFQSHVTYKSKHHKCCLKELAMTSTAEVISSSVRDTDTVTLIEGSGQKYSWSSRYREGVMAIPSFHAEETTDSSRTDSLDRSFSLFRNLRCFTGEKGTPSTSMISLYLLKCLCMRTHLFLRVSRMQGSDSKMSSEAIAQAACRVKRKS